MGEDGVLIHASSEASNGLLTDKVEALNNFPKDVADAGDSMLVASALALAAGGSISESACIGSMTAALRVASLGNAPLRAVEFDSLFLNVWNIK
jgi:bifunctional ADP-heptose synthase (sugar kinase/adenylyltransferase)